jgi:hypothetical protein
MTWLRGCPPRSGRCGPQRTNRSHERARYSQCTLSANVSSPTECIERSKGPAERGAATDRYLTVISPYIP